MGAFDRTYTDLTCPSCGTIPQERVEVQFKIFIGRTFEPQCQTVEIGERLKGMPPIAVVEDSAIYCCEACEALPQVVVRFERGVLTSVEPFRDFLAELPRPRSPQKVQRRWLAVMERSRRSRLKAPPLPTGISGLAAAMAIPLRSRLDYQSIGRACFSIEVIGTKRIGPYIKVPGDRWKRDPMQR